MSWQESGGVPYCFQMQQLGMQRSRQFPNGQTYSLSLGRRSLGQTE